MIFAKQIFLHCARAHRKPGPLICTQDATLTTENTSVLNHNEIVDFLDSPFHIHFIFIYCNMHNVEFRLHFFFLKEVALNIFISLQVLLVVRCDILRQFLLTVALPKWSTE